VRDHSIIIETQRLLLRRLQSSDISALTDLWCDPVVTRYIGGPRNRAEIKALLEEEAKDPFSEKFSLWPVEGKQTRNVIGDCGLIEKEVEGKEEIELVYVFIQSVWRKGYATEIADALKKYAFKSLGLRRLITLIDPGNVGSEKVAVKIGMHLEKEVVRPNGKSRRVYVAEV